MKTCEYCHNEIPPTLVGRPASKFCSKICKEKQRSDRQKAERIAAKENRVCLFCQKSLTVQLKGNAQTCSKECSIAHQNRMKSERSAHARIGRLCVKCNQELNSSIKKGALYCSEDCKKSVLNQRYRDRNRHKPRERLYGITEDQYNQFLSDQNNKCAICHTDEPGGKGGWHVDHNHDTGIVRGLLCHKCNVGLGHFNDDSILIDRASKYLSKS